MKIISLGRVLYLESFKYNGLWKSLKFYFYKNRQSKRSLIYWQRIARKEPYETTPARLSSSFELSTLNEQGLDPFRQDILREADKYAKGVFSYLGSRWIDLSLTKEDLLNGCLLYTSPSPRDLSTSRMPSSA